MNKKIIIVLVAIVVLAGGAWAFIAVQPKASAPSGTRSSSSNANDQSQANVEIIYTDEGFSPQSLSVKKNTVIKIVNHSSGPLEFSSDDHPTHLKDPELNMSTLPSGESGTVEVTKPGTWGFHNHLKSRDGGSLTVTE